MYEEKHCVCADDELIKMYAGKKSNLSLEMLESVVANKRQCNLKWTNMVNNGKRSKESKELKMNAIEIGQSLIVN